MKQPLKEYLAHNTLLLDGAMGTLYATRNPNRQHACEWGNLLTPAEVEAIHRSYIEAGCTAIKTNTFSAGRPSMGADFQTIIRAGCEIARKAAGDDAYIFADIGPIADGGSYNLTEEYILIADCFIEQGMTNFLFETFAGNAGLHEAAAYIRSVLPEAFIAVTFAAQPDGFTAEGLHAKALLTAAAQDPSFDAVGLNCVSGPWHMKKLVQTLFTGEKIFAAMPNAGYPTVRDRRPTYDSDPAYFAMQLADMQALGVHILGGCCGTTPEFIRAAAEELRKKPAPRVRYPAGQADARPAEEHPANTFWDELCDPDAKPFAVELDPPENAEIGRFMDGARQLQEAGASVITIADCPVARARMDSGILACKLHRELQMPALPHMTCRDRNRNATQAVLLGLCAEGIQNVLLVTGDPIPTASRDEVKSVYNFNSRKLLRYVSALNDTLLTPPLRLFAALNINAHNFHIQLDLARQKEDFGAQGFLTQPVLTPQAFENLQLARQTLHGKILGGIIPVVSHRNALFMNNSISGITVDEKIIALYEDADRVRGEELAVEISTHIAREIAPYIDGYYLITPFGRTALMARIMDSIRAGEND